MYEDILKNLTTSELSRMQEELSKRGSLYTEQLLHEVENRIQKIDEETDFIWRHRD